MGSKSEAGQTSLLPSQKWHLKSDFSEKYIKLGHRILPKLHFCYNQNFCTSSLGKVIEPGSQNCADFSSPGISYWEEILMAKRISRNFEPGRPASCQSIWPSKYPPNKDFCLFRRLHFFSPLAPPLINSLLRVSETVL